MHTLYLIIALSVFAYAGIQTPLWLTFRALRHLPSHDKERSEYIIEKMIASSKQSGALCRLCSGCNRVVHKYDLSADGIVTCHDCKAGTS